MGGFRWLCVAMGGYRWLCVAMGGYTWLWVAMYGYMSQWVAMGGYVWQCVTTCQAFSGYSHYGSEPFLQFRPCFLDLRRHHEISTSTMHCNPSANTAWSAGVLLEPPGTAGGEAGMENLDFSHPNYSYACTAKFNSTGALNSRTRQIPSATMTTRSIVRTFPVRLIFKTNSVFKTKSVQHRRINYYSFVRK